MNWMLIIGGVFVLFLLPLRIVVTIGFLVLVATLLDPDTVQQWVEYVYTRLTNGSLT